MTFRGFSNPSTTPPPLSRSPTLRYDCFLIGRSRSVVRSLDIMNIGYTYTDNTSIESSSALPKRAQTKGKCSYCGLEVTKTMAVRHLAKCPQRQEVIAQADQKKSAPLDIYHLRIQDAYTPIYWLEIEMPGTSTLSSLDTYLRSIWLECCGHLSAFNLGSFSNEISKSGKIASVFSSQVALHHIYDFGTSSETLIKPIEIRQGKPITRNPVELMIRNVMPVETCLECDDLATHLCMECLQELDSPGFLCDRHTVSHPHKDYGAPIPMVNSPRFGMCGYEGPAEPPY